MIYPAPRAIVLMAAGAPVALAIGVAVPSLWLLPLGWAAVVLALAAFDLVVAPRARAVAPWVDAPGAVGVGEGFAVELGARFTAATPARVEAALGVPAIVASVSDGRAVLAGGGDASLALTALRRGAATLGPLALRWTGPLGLVFRQRIGPSATVLVTPDIRPIRQEAPRLLARDARAGLTARVALGGEAEFDSLIEYVPGIDRRRIDWKHSARSSTLIAREHRPERDNSVVLAIDCGRLMGVPVDGLARLDRAIAAALLAGYVALRSGDRVRLEAFAARPRVTSGGALSGPGAFAALRRVAATIDYAAEETNPTLGLANIGGRLTRRSLILLFTDFTDTVGAELLLRAAAPILKRHRLICAVIADSELEAFAAAEPVQSADVARAVAAAALLRERRIVLERLRRMGVDVVEARWDALGPALARRYLALKSAGPL